MGLPVLGASFVEDSLARVGKQKEDCTEASSVLCFLWIGNSFLKFY